MKGDKPRMPQRPSIPSMIAPAIARPIRPDSEIPTGNKLVARPRRWFGNQKLRYSTPGTSPTSHEPSRNRCTYSQYSFCANIIDTTTGAPQHRHAGQRRRLADAQQQQVGRHLERDMAKEEDRGDHRERRLVHL